VKRWFISQRLHHYHVLHRATTKLSFFPYFMKSTIRSLGIMLATALLTSLSPAHAEQLRLHAIFDSDMVLQRGKPITIWGWAAPGASVSVRLGTDKADAKAAADKGRWEVTLPAREASADPQDLTVTAGGEKVEMGNIVVGDVWVMYGQSNMAFPLGKIFHSDMEAAQANLPNLRLFSITTNEQADLPEDIRRETIDTGGWVASTPETALEFSAIGYVFGSQIQRALGIPIGVIKNSRGGASMEGLVPFRKFQEIPKGKALVDSIAARRAAFDPKTEALRVYEIQLARAKGKKLPEARWPKKPEAPWDLPSWNIPGKSPGHPGSVYNGMFGVFKGFNIKGVLLHHGYNNAMVRQGLRPKFYRWMTKALIEGVREDFNDPHIAYGVIGFCAGGDAQNEENFEAQPPGPAFIREAQRLGVADLKDAQNAGYIPAYDVQVRGLHPGKKREHGVRAARWALKKIYGRNDIMWDEATLLSVETKGDVMILNYDKRVQTDNSDNIIRGFSIAGEDGKYYMAHARNSSAGQGNVQAKSVHVWSPLVKNPVALRYAWGHSPMGNLKILGRPDMPLPEFRTDTWDLPESDDLLTEAITREFTSQWDKDGKARLEFRRTEEAKRALEILERLKTLGQP
jgi:sialate O-acetylesterase